ncbi:MAG: metX, partial [Frankiales bacterium]|nr:metX [Frankiales bacterium]
NAVLVCHALTADAHVTGPPEPGHPGGGWWSAVVGPGAALDPARWFVVAANVLGGCQGSTGPASQHPDGLPWGSRFPALTVRDHVAAEVALADHLGVGRWAGVLGGSMGGMRALEWAVTEPDRVAALFALACPAATSAEQLAWCSPQLAAIQADPHWHGGDYYQDPVGPVTGLGIARRIAHVTYRSERELGARFGRAVQPDETGRFAVESYLDHQADKLVRRFDAGSYVSLTRVMASHDIGRGRGGVAAALARVTARTVVAGIDSDRLYPLHQQQELADGLGVPLHVVTSPAGHDGFLLEAGQVGALVREALGD